MNNKIKVTTFNETCIVIEVPSSRGGKHIAKYNRVTGKWTCTCEDYFYRERFCKHMKQAKEHLETLGLTDISETVVTNHNKETEDIDTMSELLNIKKQLYSLKRSTMSDAPEIQCAINSLNLLLQQQRVGEV